MIPVKLKIDLLLEKIAGAVKSKTIWLNAIFLLLLDQLPNLLGQLAVVLPQVQPYIGAELYRNASLFLIVGNVVLRFRTKTPLEQK